MKVGKKESMKDTQEESKRLGGKVSKKESMKNMQGSKQESR